MEEELSTVRHADILVQIHPEILFLIIEIVQEDIWYISWVRSTDITPDVQVMADELVEEDVEE